MKIQKLKIFIFSTIFLNIFFLKNIFLTSLDGTSNIVYKTQNWVFHGSDKAQGFVRLNSGFTILHNATGQLDTFMTVSGPIDLRETGTLDLLDNLRLESTVTLSSGGYIYGRGNSIILNGDLTLPTEKILHINNNTIINGNGHDLIINNHAQIFVDTNITLTLKNLRLRNVVNPLTFPPVRLAALNSKLCLDNVILSPSDDFLFSQGNLFINNDVLFTGTHSFIYQSTQASFINSNSSLSFDKNTTFSFVPATNNKDLILLQDKNSSIFFDNCDLKTTYTGLRLANGRLFFDNKVNIDTTSSVNINSLSLIDQVAYDVNIKSVNWSPDGKFLAIGGYTAGTAEEIVIYSFTGTSLSKLTEVAYNYIVNSVNWSPDGKYLAVGGESGASEEVVIYSFTGTSLNKVAEIAYDANIYSVNFSPDGKYLAIGGSGGLDQEIAVYKFTGTSLTKLTEVAYNANIYSVNFSPDGKYLAIGGATGGLDQEIVVYNFTGTSLTKITEVAYDATVWSVNWSPDGKYLAIGGATGLVDQEIVVYNFTGTSLTKVAEVAYDSDVDSVNWSPDGRYLAVGGYTTGTDQEIVIYSFTGTSLIKITEVAYDKIVNSVNWSPNGKYLAIGGSTDGTAQELVVYGVNFVSDTNSQALSNSLVFGDYSKGASSNLNVKVLSAALVNLTGQINDDSV